MKPRNDLYAEVYKWGAIWEESYNKAPAVIQLGTFVKPLRWQQRVEVYAMDLSIVLGLECLLLCRKSDG